MPGAVQTPSPGNFDQVFEKLSFVARCFHERRSNYYLGPRSGIIYGSPLTEKNCSTRSRLRKLIRILQRSYVMQKVPRVDGNTKYFDGKNFVWTWHFSSVQRDEEIFQLVILENLIFLLFSFERTVKMTSDFVELWRGFEIAQKDI